MLPAWQRAQHAAPLRVLAETVLYRRRLADGFSSDRENQKSRPFEKCAQDESLRDSRDGPGATKGGACKGFLQADYRRMALKEPLSMRRATSAMSGARERSASTAGETFLTMS